MIKNKRLKFVQKFRYEIVCTSTVGANNAKYRDIFCHLPVPSFAVYIVISRDPKFLQVFYSCLLVSNINIRRRQTVPTKTKKFVLSYASELRPIFRLIECF